MSKPKLVTFDIDSTLAHTQARAEKMIDKIDRSKTDWLAYALASGDDPETPVAVLARLLHTLPGVEVGVVTYRPVFAEAITEAWLGAHGIEYSVLCLAPMECDMTTAEYKVASLRELQKDYDVILHVDDYWPITQAIEKELGIPTITVSVYGPDPWKE